MMSLLRSRTTQMRFFTQASPFLAARSTPSRPPPPMPSFRAPAKSIPTTTKASPTKTKIPAPHSPPPPPQQRPPPTTVSRPESYALKLLGNSDSLLLYKAPRNVALFTSCFIVGGSIFYWTATVANGAFMEYTAPWWAKLVVLAGCLATSAIATAVVATPHHLIKSISIVKVAEKQAMIRLKGTRYFPFAKQAVFDVTPGKLLADKNVAMSLENDGRKWYDIKLDKAREWTEGSLKRPNAIEGNAFQKLNRRMLNVGPAMFSQVKKMFQRTGFLFVQIEGKNWKMDLENCEILESGEVLMKLVREAHIRRDLMAIVAQSVSGKSDGL